MTVTIELRDLQSQTGSNLARWAEILAEPVLAKLPDRMETVRHGQIFCVARSTVVIQIAALRSRLEKQPTDLRRLLSLPLSGEFSIRK